MKPSRCGAPGRAVHTLCVALLACGSATLTRAKMFNMMPNPAPYVPATYVKEIVREFNGAAYSPFLLYSGFGGGVRFIAKGSGLRTADGSFGGGAQVFVGNQQASVLEFLSSNDQIVFDSPPMDRQSSGFQKIKVRTSASSDMQQLVWSP